MVLQNNRKFIFGKATLAKILAKLLLESNITPEAFVVDDTYFVPNEEYFGIPVISQSTFVKICPPCEGEIFVTVGYSNMNHNRKIICEKFMGLGYKLGTYVHPSALIDSDSKIGGGSLIFQLVEIDAFSNIGIGNILLPKVHISHEAKIGDYNYFGPCACFCGNVTLGNQCFIGANACIKNGVKIYDKCLVGASSYVAHDLEEERVIVPERSVILNKKSSEISI